MTHTHLSNKELEQSIDHYQKKLDLLRTFKHMKLTRISVARKLQALTAEYLIR